jgi:hypothetical protein
VQLVFCTWQIGDSEIVIRRENREPIVPKLIGKIKCILQCGPWVLVWVENTRIPEMARDTLKLPAGNSPWNISSISTAIPSGSSLSSCIALEKPREQDITYSSTDLET